MSAIQREADYQESLRKLTDDERLELEILRLIDQGWHTHDDIRDGLIIHYQAHGPYPYGHDDVGGKLRSMAGRGDLHFERRQITYSWYGRPRKGACRET